MVHVVAEYEGQTADKQLRQNNVAPPRQKPSRIIIIGAQNRDRNRGGRGFAFVLYGNSSLRINRTASGNGRPLARSQACGDRSGQDPIPSFRGEKRKPAAADLVCNGAEPTRF